MKNIFKGWCASLFFFAVFFTIPNLTKAQTSTDIYLIDIDLRSYNLNYTNLINITNRKGYDNQPHFSANGNHILFSSIRKDEQADIYKYEIENGKLEQITDTKANEFSPTYFNREKFISSVQQDVDSLQHLVRINLKNNKRKTLLKKEKLIGYHSWLSRWDLALFIVGEPHELHRGRTYLKKSTKIDEKIGAALQKVPYRKAVGYQFFEDTSNCVIREYYYKAKFAKDICPCLKDAVSFVYLKNGNIISGKGQQLYLFNKRSTAKGWVLIADFSDIPDFDFYRIAINWQETKMALVVNRAGEN